MIDFRSRRVRLVIAVSASAFLFGYGFLIWRWFSRIPILIENRTGGRIDGVRVETASGIEELGVISDGGDATTSVPFASSDSVTISFRSPNGSSRQAKVALYNPDESPARRNRMRVILKVDPGDEGGWSLTRTSRENLILGINFGSEMIYEHTIPYRTW